MWLIFCVVLLIALGAVLELLPALIIIFFILLIAAGISVIAKNTKQKRTLKKYAKRTAAQKEKTAQNAQPANFQKASPVQHTQKYEPIQSAQIPSPIPTNQTQPEPYSAPTPSKPTNFEKAIQAPTLKATEEEQLVHEANLVEIKNKIETRKQFLAEKKQAEKARLIQELNRADKDKELEQEKRLKRIEEIQQQIDARKTKNSK